MEGREVKRIGLSFQERLNQHWREKYGTLILQSRHKEKERNESRNRSNDRTDLGSHPYDESNH